MLIVFRSNGFIGGYEDHDGEYRQNFNTTPDVFINSLKRYIGVGEHDDIKIFIEDENTKFNCGLPSLEDYLKGVLV